MNLRRFDSRVERRSCAFVTTGVTHRDGVEVDAREAIRNLYHLVDGLGGLALLGNHLYGPIDVVGSYG